MRYSVQFETGDRHWVVKDVANADQVMGVHITKAEAYRQAIAEQELWRKYDPVAKHLARVRRIMPNTLVVR